MHFPRADFAQLTELRELPQRRVIVATRSPESCPSIGGKKPFDDAAVTQGRQGPIYLFD